MALRGDYDCLLVLREYFRAVREGGSLTTALGKGWGTGAQLCRDLQGVPRFCHTSAPLANLSPHLHPDCPSAGGPRQPVPDAGAWAGGPGAAGPPPPRAPYPLLAPLSVTLVLVVAGFVSRYKNTYSSSHEFHVVDCLNSNRPFSVRLIRIANPLSTGEMAVLHVIQIVASSVQCLGNTSSCVCA